MTKQQLWAIYAKRNPSFEGDGNVTLSARGLRKMFDVTWDTAFYDGEDEPAEPATCQSQTVESLMSIFGMKR